MDYKVFDKYNITRNTMLEAALFYSEKYHLAVFPLEAQGKKPATAHGLKEATTDPEQIRKWWKSMPFANIGIACGDQSGGLLVVDLDVDKDSGKNGLESLRDWEKEHGELPETAMTITGRGGNHLFYRAKGETRSRIACKEGIDIRADGGYIVAPPSIHPNGTQYEWENELVEYGIQDADQSVIDLMLSGVEVGTAFTMPEKVPEGERNGTLYRLACSMQARGNSDDSIFAAVRAENVAKCDPPLDDSEVIQIVESARKKPKGTSTYKGEAKEPETKPLDTYTIREIRNMGLEAPEFFVPGILPKGVCILGAPPKAGKSWMALDLAVQIANGGTFLGRNCRQAHVLYLALEDSFWRVQERTDQLTGRRDVDDRMRVAIQADHVNPKTKEAGLYWQILLQLEKFPDTELVIVDTLQMVTPSKQKGDDAYSSTYTLLNSLRPLFQDRGISFLLVHHTRKRSVNDVDPFETFLGSQALTGATDAMYVIQAVKDKDYSTFLGRGRDFEDIELAIVRDPVTCRWHSQGTVKDMEAMSERTEYEQDPICSTILKILEEANDIPQIVRTAELKERIIDDWGYVVPESNKTFSTNIINKAGPLLMKYDRIKVERMDADRKGARIYIKRV